MPWPLDSQGDDLTQREFDEVNAAMASSGIKRRQLQRVECRFLHCLLQLCLACLVACELRDLSFVPAASWVGHGTKGKARKRSTQRFSQTRAIASGKARILTSKIKNAQSAKQLIQTLDGTVSRHIFNFFHASAAYTQLVSLKRRKSLQESDWNSPVLLRLHARVEDMMLQDELDAQGSTNIFWTLAQLSDRFSIPTPLLAALVKSMPAKVRNMKPQELSNCLWASAQLKDVAPDVLETVPAVTAQIPNKAKDMVPQALSNCLLAALQLKDTVPEVLEIVPAIVGEIPAKIQGMVPQALSNSLEALVLLRDSNPRVAAYLAAGSLDDIVRSAAARLNTLLPSLSGKDLTMAVSIIMWACAKAEVNPSELLVSVARRLGSGAKLRSVPDFNLCALLWSYQVLDAQDEFADFRKLLISETKKRRVSEADVASCELGRFQWNGA